MRKHYNLDGLADYSTTKISEPATLVNPEYRAIRWQGAQSCR
jgi:hypothetical protein